MSTVKSIDGEEIFYEVVGTDNITIIPLAGLGTPNGRIAWKYQLSLSDQYKLLLIDIAGFGKSTKTRVNYTMELFAQDVKAVVEELNLTNIILIGQSMGGPIIMEAERLISDRTLGLIPIDSLFQIGPNTRDESMINEMIKPFEENFIDTWMKLLNSLITENLDSEDVEMFKILAHELDPRSVISSYRSLLKWDLYDVLPSVNKPIKCIAAGRTFQKQEDRDKYEENFDAVYLEDSGHAMMFEKPDRFNQVLLSRIEEILKIARIE